MAPTYDDAPEVAPSESLPEVYGSHEHQPAWSPQQSTVAPTYASQTPVKAEDPASTQGYGTDSRYYLPTTAPENPGSNKKGTICGCSLVVLILSIIIAVLSAVVIGLAAGTGVATSNYNDANSKLQDLRASFSSLATATATATTASASATSTSYSNITNGCSDANEDTTGTTYTSKFFNEPTFTMFCNKDAPNSPLYSLFVANFDGCMDACASWNSYNASSNLCEAVSFIPKWSIEVYAVEGHAPGDCYLKPGPQNRTGLDDPNIGTECHAAILKD